MSRHQAVRNMDYEAELDDFDADADEGGDGLTPEDREALARGTEDVRAILGSEASTIPTDQIHESLWYYFYDIEKTVSYLRKKFVNPAPTPKSESKKPKESTSLSPLPPRVTQVAQGCHMQKLRVWQTDLDSSRLRPSASWTTAQHPWTPQEPFHLPITSEICHG